MPAEIIPLDPERKKKPKFTRDKTYPFLYLHNESGFYYVRKLFKRERLPELFKTTGETAKLKAKHKAEDMIQQHRNLHTGVEDRGAFGNDFGQAHGKLVSEICDEIIEKVTPHRRVQTRKQHKLYVGKYIRAKFGDMGINAITVDHFDAWVEELRKTFSPRTGKPRKTFKNYAKHMNLLFTHAYQKKYTKHRLRFSDPDKRIRRELEEKPRKALSAVEREILELKKARCLKRDEIREIVSKLNDTWRLRFILSLESFMRFSEAGNLEWDRVNLETGLITLRAQDVKTGSKTGKGRRFYVSELGLELLRKRAKGQWRHGKGEKHHPDSPYVFPNFRDPHRPASHNQRIWKDALKLSGIRERVRWHDIRHTALTLALVGDESLPEAERKAMVQDPLLVSEFAGVSLEVIREVYLHAEAEHTRRVPQAFKSLGLRDLV